MGDCGEGLEAEKGSPLRYLPLSDVYSLTSPSSTKVKPPLIHFYTRRKKKPRLTPPNSDSQSPQSTQIGKKLSDASSTKKKWVSLSYNSADPNKFIGLRCQVYWPLDADWYSACILSYNPQTHRHHVKYDDEDQEDLILSNETIKFHISVQQMRQLNVTYSTRTNSNTHALDENEMLVLAAAFDYGDDVHSADVVWAKVTGHAMWPGIVLNASFVGNLNGLNKHSGENSVPVQFFGTYDFARLKKSQVVSFIRGLLSSFHLKCKRTDFVRGLEEAKLYLSEQKLPERMQLQNGSGADEIDSGENNSGEPSNSGHGLNFSKSKSARNQDLPAGYRPVHVKWKHLDKCNVCDMDEEYVNNLFLQCDKCRMMVHARCYGELEPVDGKLWLCNMCRPEAPQFPPPCCLCPLIGGAMKPTTDGRWAHLACAIWIPETCLSDVKKMEPIDGISRISKDRWKLLCSICGVSYGACIQCSNSKCYVAYHPLCARVAGFCDEFEDEDRLHLIPFDEDGKNEGIQLVSFCKKHRPVSNVRQFLDERIDQTANLCPDYIPPINSSGCARCEPYNYSGRRGRKAPEAIAAASLKRLFVENRPHLVGGYSQHEPPFILRKLAYPQVNSSRNIDSMSEKYKHMTITCKKRLTFGKSRIHGFGIFARQLHRAGDMVIEYIGEVVRHSIADRREHLIYNSLVGAGTYMFRVDDERVIDATRAGSVAHLINHSCEPNCYSRVITVTGDEHIIIFAKRDIKQWEELTYDYRFLSTDEQLSCYCGSSRCRGVVNDIDAEEQKAKFSAPRSELIGWTGE